MRTNTYDYSAANRRSGSDDSEPPFAWVQFPEKGNITVPKACSSLF